MGWMGAVGPSDKSLSRVMGTRTSGLLTACPSRDTFRDRSAMNPGCHSCFMAFAGGGWDSLTLGCEWGSALVGTA